MTQLNMKRIKGKNYRAVKLRHPDLRNCSYAVTLFDRPYPTPYPCGLCNLVHTHKTMHFYLDNNGEVTIHEALYETLKASGVVEDLPSVAEVIPAPMTLDMGRNDQPAVVVAQESGMVKGPDVPPRPHVVPRSDLIIAR